MLGHLNDLGQSQPLPVREGGNYFEVSNSPLGISTPQILIESLVRLRNMFARSFKRPVQKQQVIFCQHPRCVAQQAFNAGKWRDMNHVDTDDSVIFLALANSPAFSLCVNRQGRENLRILSICPGGYAFPAVWIGIARLPFGRRKSGLKINCVLPGTGCNFKNSSGCRQTIA